MKSSTVRRSFPSDVLRPLPSCCMKTVPDSVGRRNITMSIDGMSTPSLNMSTVNTILAVPDSSSLTDSPRSSESGADVTHLDSTPLSMKKRCMNRACPMDEQNARALFDGNLW